MIAGTLTDKGMNDAGKMIARIDDRPYEVPGYVLPYLAPIEKGMRVEFTESNDVITKIMSSQKPPTISQEKLTKAGFGVSNTVPSPVPAEVPVKKLNKVFDGAILSINHEKRSVALDGGAILIWSQDKDETMKKFNARYKCRVEHDGEHLLSIVSTFVPSNGAGKLSGKNENLIVYQTCYKECCETVRSLMLVPDDVIDETLFNQLMDLAITRAKDDAEALIEASRGA